MSSFLYLTTEFHKTQASLRYVKLDISSEQSNLGGLTWPTWSFLKIFFCGKTNKKHVFLKLLAYFSPGKICNLLTLMEINCYFTFLVWAGHSNNNWHLMTSFRDPPWCDIWLDCVKIAKINKNQNTL